MVYRRIRTACGSEVLEPLSEIEQAIYKRNKRNKKRKRSREEEVNAYMAGLLFFGTIIFFVAVWIIFGYAG